MTVSVDSTANLKLNKIEKVKAAKPGLAVRDELAHFAQIGWEAMDKDDLEVRLKWLGVFYRPVTPGKFMMRLRVPNGCMTATQMRALGAIVARYGEDGSADITTRQNLQLRGVRLEDLPEIFSQLAAVGLTSVQSGMDNVRNITGSPVAGLDPDEYFDTRDLIRRLQDRLTQNGVGNPAFTDLPRKFNIAIDGGRDNSIHAEINDLAFIPAFRDGVFGFNVLVGGFLSAQRCAEALPMDVWVPADDTVIALCEAILRLYSEQGLAAGLRANRQKARIMYLIDQWGMEKFRAEVETYLGTALLTAAPAHAMDRDKSDHLGIHPQKQAGYVYAGLHVPMGRFTANQMEAIARLAEVYGNGEIRLTVEQNVILPYIPQDTTEALLQEPLLETLRPDPSPLSRSVISCTGGQFCNFAMIETKQRAWALAQELDRELQIDRRVRIHWTGCPNACGQPHMGDIGLIGAKARQEGKMVEGVDLYQGGQVGPHAQLATLRHKGIPCGDLKAQLREILIQDFGATPKTAAP